MIFAHQDGRKKVNTVYRVMELKFGNKNKENQEK
ncbi:hypothetical protein VIBRN418_01957 [Vibrio sp. N418]|uniref:Uncharacterized protein n=1 Tax=Vibrio scophthalmi LMG 19158 TaxID=870967 RepID=F9RU30_9VIBR|nr:hypothetical protein VIS19158_08458 [Vibrio scophthalmi LMG 19158]EGU35661.1 hypothetical protein VIBRN418_01957 [Vibrio sp. N418]